MTFVRVLFISALVAVFGICSGKADLTVVSYNIHNGTGMDGVRDLARIAKVALSQNPDVVMLQEVDNKTKRSDEVDQTAELARLMSMHGRFYQAMPYSGGGYGLAIFSKYPLENTRTLALEGGQEPRCAAMAEIVKDGIRVGVINTHLDARKTDVHVKHVEMITAEAKKYADAGTPVIFGGDFNARETSPIWEPLRAANWVVPQKQGVRFTIPSGKPNREIDWFILMQPATKSSPSPSQKTQTMSVKSYKVVEEAVASDHRPIVITVGFQETAAAR